MVMRVKLVFNLPNKLKMGMISSTPITVATGWVGYKWDATPRWQILHISSVESQKSIIIIQQCVENQKGAIAVQIRWW